MDLYAVAIMDQYDRVTPITHNVTREIANSICRHYNKVIAREKRDPWDDTTCIMLSQTYCTNWQDFI